MKTRARGGWRKFPSTTSGGKPYFWARRSPRTGEREWVLWDRETESWSYAAEKPLPEGRTWGFVPLEPKTGFRTAKEAMAYADSGHATMRGADDGNRKSIRDFVIEHGITASVEPAYRNPNMDDDQWSRSASHYKVTLKLGPRRLTTYFSMGSALKEPPTAADVLNSLVMDAAGVEQTSGFEDWAREYGFELDDVYSPAYRRTKRTYKIVVSQTEKLKKFLGQALYEQALYETEWL